MVLNQQPYRNQYRFASPYIQHRLAIPPAVVAQMAKPMDPETGTMLVRPTHLAMVTVKEKPTVNYLANCLVTVKV